MASEGSREIEAAKLRLAAARTQKASATKALASAEETKKLAQAMLASATKTSEEAKSQLQTSEKEIESAKTFLKEAEKRWEVIDIDADEEASPQESGQGTKRRKVSLSPGSGAGGARNPASTNAAGTSESASGETVLQAIRNGSKLIVIEGAGWRDFNGIYKQLERCVEGVRIYWKRSRPGLNHDHVIFYQSGQWCIGFDRGDSVPFNTIYFSPDTGTVGVPPEEGWFSHLDCWNPAPRCLTNQDTRTAGGACTPLKVTVGGCGSSEANGIYVRQGTLSDGTRMYGKDGQWEGKAARFLICRQTHRGGKTWCIAADTTPLYANAVAGSSESPPMVGWKVLGKGQAPVPTLRNTWIDELSRGISGISVKDSGIPEVNGMYRPWVANHVSRMEDGVPVFRKSGRWEGTEVDFVLFRKATSGGKKYWYIREQRGLIILYRGFHNPGIVGPVENEWYVRNGIAPAPTVDVLL